MTSFEMDIELNGKLCEVTVHGDCVRDMLGTRKCTVRKVLLADGTDIYGAVPQDLLAPMEVRLWSACLSERHPLGEEAAV